MAVKYHIVFRPKDNIRWNVDISSNLWTGDSTRVNGNSEACIINWESEKTDDPYSCFVKSTTTLNIVNKGEIDVNELQQAQDKDFTVSVYRAGVLFWKGYLVTEGISQKFQSLPYNLQLTAICGLGMLDAPFVYGSYPLMTATSRSLISYIRQILFINLGIQLPIRWTNDLQNTKNFGQDVFSVMEWAANGEGYTEYQADKPNKSCEYILRGMLEAMQCRIYQTNGMWVIRRVNDFLNGNINYRQVPATGGVDIIQQGTENVVKLIGRSGYRMILEDQIITSERGFKSVKVTYNANQYENVLPNGNFDRVTGSFPNFKPIYWDTYFSTLGINTVSSLNKRDGYAVELDNSTGLAERYFTLKTRPDGLGNNGLPMDTFTIVKRISFGFTFLLTSGFPVSGGNVNWSTRPFEIQIIFNTGLNKLYLNEFGFWQPTDTRISIEVDGYQLLDVAKVDFDRFKGIVMPSPPTQPIAGDISDIQVIFVVKDGQVFTLDDAYITIDDNKEVYESTMVGTKNTTVDERSLEISSAFGGYMVSNIMSIFSESDAECFYRDAFVYEGCLTGLTANAMMRLRYNSSRIFNGTVFSGDWNFDQLYIIDTMGESKFMPLSANYNIEKSQVSLVAFEVRNDDIPLTENFYGSNDNQLSN